MAAFVGRAAKSGAKPVTSLSLMGSPSTIPPPEPPPVLPAPGSDDTRTWLIVRGVQFGATCQYSVQNFVPSFDSYWTVYPAPGEAFVVGTKSSEKYPFTTFTAVLCGATVAPLAAVKPCQETITCPLKGDPSALLIVSRIAVRDCALIGEEANAKPKRNSVNSGRNLSMSP